MNWESGYNPTCGTVCVARTTTHSFTIYKRGDYWHMTASMFPIVHVIQKELFRTLEDAKAAAEDLNGGSPDR